MKIVVLLLFIILISSMWQFPSATPAFGIACLLFSLAVAISSIFKKHEQSENPRPKIVKDVLILVIILLLILVLGGLLGIYANHYVSTRFGVFVGVISAMGASFAVGYLVNKGVGKIFKG